ncbi:MAG TPA: hypothetical protein EYQ31_09395 [Candidatus Handelsmanbacteria bacterium]|nr:hypothetical protein [Candidatus Handelsmanbacteria bacterium]
MPVAICLAVTADKDSTQAIQPGKNARPVAVAGMGEDEQADAPEKEEPIELQVRRAAAQLK